MSSGEQSLNNSKDAPKTGVLSNFTQRIVTGVIALPPALIAVALGGGWFTALLLLLVILAALEFYTLGRGREIQGSALIGLPTAVAVMLSFHLDSDVRWIFVGAALLTGTLASFILETVRHPRDPWRSILQTGTMLAGVLYVGFPAGFAVAIRSIPNDGLMWLLLGLVGALGTDTFAYLGGRLFGRTSLAPTVSPSKTTEGAVIGITVGFLLGLLILLVSDKITMPNVLLVFAAPFIGTAGDLLESGIKRFFRAKDSHIEGLDILPGHGGILDRIDSSLLIIAVFYFYVLVMGVLAL